MSELEFLEIEWLGDPRIMAARFDELAADLEEKKVALLAAMRQIIIDDVKEHFEREQGPSGEAWEDWAPSYAPRALSENIGILRKTEELYDAATSLEAYPIIGDDVWVATNEFPDYWDVHQEGTRDNRIPARPFIGTSAAAQGRMNLIFHQWANGEMNILFSPLTGVSQPRLKSGRMGRRIGLR